MSMSIAQDRSVFFKPSLNRSKEYYSTYYYNYDNAKKKINWLID